MGVIRDEDRVPTAESIAPDLATPTITVASSGASGDLRDATTPGSPLDQQRSVERAEHVANLLRLRRSLTAAVLAWPAFGIADLIVDRFIYPGTLMWTLGIRAGATPVILAAILRLHTSPPPSPRLLRWLVLTVYVSGCAGIAAMCIPLGGFGSLYFGGSLLVVAVYTAMVADHWRHGIVAHSLMFACYPVTLLGAALVLPAVRAQLASPELCARFAIHCMFLLTVAVTAVISGHQLWAARRQVYEARNIGKYRLKHRLGTGGMGEVWAAYHSTLKRDIALKLLSPGRTPGPEGVQRFEREVQTTTELNHPNTVRVFDYGVTDDGIWYYAMELLDGCSLSELVDREGPLPAARAIHFAVQGARALAEAHARGITHRDVKPDNLFVTWAGMEGDFIKVLDFGIAKLAHAKGAETLTSTGVLVGTPAYMSPEAAAGRPVDARSDVYSLGATLYFMLSGKPPFEAPSVAAVLVAHLSAEPMLPSQRLGAPVPTDIEAVVMRCLAKDPATRYADAGALAEALTALEVFGCWTPASRAAESGARPRASPDSPTLSTGGPRAAHAAAPSQASWSGGAST